VSNSKILFVDRDGTLVEEPPDEQVDSLEKIRFMPGVFAALRQARSAGFGLAMVTNQDGLGSSSFPQAAFDVAHQFILDAFSSDSIPVHLVTSEAVSLYLTRLAPHGILIFQISNRYLSLGPIMGRLAAAHGLTALQRIDSVGDDVLPNGKTSSKWVVMARTRDDLSPLISDSRWTVLTPSPSTPLWSDDFSNILGVFRP